MRRIIVNGKAKLTILAIVAPLLAIASCVLLLIHDIGQKPVVGMLALATAIAYGWLTRLAVSESCFFQWQTRINLFCWIVICVGYHAKASGIAR